MGSRDVGVTIDGRIDEAIWRDVPGYDNMLVMDPDTLVEPRYKTDVRLFYTDKGLYIAAFMEQPKDTLVSAYQAEISSSIVMNLASRWIPLVKGCTAIGLSRIWVVR